MTYQIRFTEPFTKQFEKLERSVQERVSDKIHSITDDPFSQVKRLKGVDLYSLRVGDYRVIISIENKLMVIFALEVGHRSRIYKKY
jgi:mRNA interferase RelE/StbE